MQHLLLVLVGLSIHSPVRYADGDEVVAAAVVVVEVSYIHQWWKMSYHR